MSKVMFLRLSLLLPVLALLVAIGLRLMGYFSSLSHFLIWSAIAGGIPYALLCIGLLVLSYKASAERFFYWWMYSPFLLAILFGVFAAGIQLYHGGTAGSFFITWLILGLYSLMVGYSYLAIACAFYFVMKKLGLVQEEPQPSNILTA